MKIILSPTKTMNIKSEYYANLTQPEYYVESEVLRNTLKQYSSEEMKRIFKISEQLSHKVKSFFEDTEIRKSALSLYQGQAFKALELNKWSESDLEYANQHLLILSALYGVLRPSDAVSAYRLDFYTDLDIDLYEFWNSKLCFNEPYYINLASQEFSVLVPNEKLINIHFLESDLSIKSTYAKTARGNMARYIIKNRIDNVSKIKNIVINNYEYDASRSDENNLYYIKKPV